MKVLNIDGLFFKLPDDFKGGLGDALRAMADYHDQPATAERQRREKGFGEGTSHEEARSKMWALFLEAISNGDRLCGSITLSAYEGKKPRKPQPLDVNTGLPEGGDHAEAK
jgi:hypothetical protein